MMVLIDITPYTNHVFRSCSKARPVGLYTRLLHDSYVSCLLFTFTFPFSVFCSLFPFLTRLYDYGPE
jgi:hypothetical protein